MTPSDTLRKTLDRTAEQLSRSVGENLIVGLLPPGVGGVEPVIHFATTAPTASMAGVFRALAKSLVHTADLMDQGQTPSSLVLPPGFKR